MTPGKIASQAGHAYVQTVLQCIQVDPSREQAYHSDGIGTKVCLEAKDLSTLLRAYNEAVEAGIPCALITDQGHMSFHGGEPTVTALGIGPVTRAESQHITKRYRLMA